MLTGLVPVEAILVWMGVVSRELDKSDANINTVNKVLEEEGGGCAGDYLGMDTGIKDAGGGLKGWFGHDSVGLTDAETRSFTGVYVHYYLYHMRDVTSLEVTRYRRGIVLEDVRAPHEDAGIVWLSLRFDGQTPDEHFLIISYRFPHQSFSTTSIAQGPVRGSAPLLRAYGQSRTILARCCRQLSPLTSPSLIPSAPVAPPTSSLSGLPIYCGAPDATSPAADHRIQPRAPTP